MTLRAGIIGAGRIGWSYDGGRWDGVGPALTHASCIERHPNLVLAAVYDPFELARNAYLMSNDFREDVTVHDTLDSFFGEGLDLVTIASPSEFHAQQLDACFDENVRLIFLEKPAATTWDEYERTVERLGQIEEKPRVCVNYTRRATPQAERLAAHAAEAVATSTPFAVDVIYSRGLQTNGVHLLDLLGLILDQATPPDLDFVRSPDHHNPQFGFSVDGATVTVTGHDLPYHLIEIHVVDRRGRMSLVNSASELVWQPSIPNDAYPGTFKVAAASVIDCGESGASALDNASYRHLESLVDPDAKLMSTLETSGFAQTLLYKVDTAIGRR